MAKINYMDRENHLREYEIKEDLITMGREATNKVVVADPSVSRQHAWIEKREDGYYLVDKNSSNGTYVNGRKVSQQKLKHQDKVNLGSASLVFEDEAEQHATYILPASEMQPADMMATMAPQERQTDEFLAEEMRKAEDRPLPPPPPLAGPPAASPFPPPPQPPPPRPEPPAPPPPPPPAPPPVAAPIVTPQAPEQPPGVLCPSCRSIVEKGARFCPSCGTPLGAGKPMTTPQPPPPPPPQASRPSMPPPPRPAAPPPPPPVAPTPVPSFGGHDKPVFATVASPGSLNYAGFGPRFVAYLIDAVILSLLMLLPLIVVFLVATPMRGGGEPSTMALIVMSACSLAMAVIGIGYQLYFVGTKGATPGKKMMKLRVTGVDGQFPIGYGKAFLRMVGYAISGMACYLGFIWILIDKEQHRGWHDKIAGTVVVRD